MFPCHIILVRHGQSEGNLAVESSKHGDDRHFTDAFRKRHSSLWRLTDLGIEQARIANQWIREYLIDTGLVTFDLWLVSEYLRAMETAAYLDLPNATWIPTPDLRERDWGHIDVTSQTERETTYRADFDRRKISKFFWVPPGGESMATLRLRGFRVMDTLHRQSETGAILVCHGDVMWMLRTIFERMLVSEYNELDDSRDPLDRIHNCQILHYTRIDPQTGEEYPTLRFMRSICPTDPTLSRNEWQPIVQRRFTNDDLLAEVKKVARIIHD